MIVEVFGEEFLQSIQVLLIKNHVDDRVDKLFFFFR